MRVFTYSTGFNFRRIIAPLFHQIVSGRENRPRSCAATTTRQLYPQIAHSMSITAKHCVRSSIVAALVAAAVQLPLNGLVLSQDENSGAGASRVDVNPYTMLAHVMRSEELNEIAGLLILSDAQIRFAELTFEEFNRRMEEITPRIAALHERTVALQLARDLPIDQIAKEVEAICRESESLDWITRQYEQDFFATLEPVLTAEQRERMYLVNWLRDRIRYQIRTDALPGAIIDLIVIVRDLEIESFATPGLNELLHAYEQKLVALLRARHVEQRRSRIREIRWRTAIEGKIIEQADLIARGRIRSSRMGLESQLRHLNLATLEAVTLLLDFRESALLHDEFHRRAHSLYARDAERDRTRRLLDQALELESLEDERTDLLTNLRDWYYAEYRRSQRRIADADFRWREKTDRTLSANVDEINAHEEEIQSLLTQRRELSERAVQLLEDILQSDELAEIGLANASGTEAGASR
jgi:hypothetical protein